MPVIPFFIPTVSHEKVREMPGPTPATDNGESMLPPWESNNLLPAIFIVVVILATAMISLIIALVVRKFGVRANADEAVRLEEGRRGGQVSTVSAPTASAPRGFAYENRHAGPTPITSASAHLPLGGELSRNPSISRRQAFDKTMTGAWGLKKMPTPPAEDDGKMKARHTNEPNPDDALEDVDLS